MGTLLTQRKALITGATSGIGLETARALKAQGYSLILTGRRADRLAKLRDELGAETLLFDVGDRAQAEKVLGQTDLSQVQILVNNAGLAIGTASLQTVELDDVDVMIDTNIKGLLYVTRLVLPSLIQNSGHLVNIGSVAGRWTYAGGATYSATKFAVRAITEALRLDLMGKPVRVTNIEPGMVETEFSEVRYNGDKEKASQVYKGMTPLKASDIAETIAWCVSRPAHVNIQELVIYPVDQAGVGPYISRR